MARKKNILTPAQADVSIYALCCPDTGDVRYIGKANAPEKRLKSHLRDARRRNTPVYCWIRKMQAAGKAPVLRILTIVPADEWVSAERRLIAEYRSVGNLLNVADGGNEPSCIKSICASNGRANAKLVHESPFRRRVWELKRSMPDVLRWLSENGRSETLVRVKAKLLIAAQKRPDLFGEWISA